MPMSKRLEGKVVAVTGATKGIGKGIALMAAAEGAKVVVSGRNAEDGRAVVEAIGRMHGMEALFVQADISRVEDAERLIRETVERFGRIDGLVNNAGIFPRSTLVETEEDLYDSIFAVNTKGPFFCSKFAIQAMMQNGGGSIVHMGSTHGYKGGASLAAYAVSKGALLTLSRHIAANYMKHGIRSNWVTVGWVATEGELELHGKNGVSHDDLKAMASKSIPTGEMQTVEDMAYGVIYLLADESRQVTNTELAISGGLNL
jgi:NAD(P)-dependent dehydrogenase (short-subunit alcohol dehydrogenase family)